MANREELIALMSQIQEDFARFVNNFERDELASAVKHIENLSDRMRTVLSEIQKNLTADFLANRARTLETDIELIKKFETRAPSRAEQSDIAVAVTHFTNSIRALDNLVKSVYPREPYSLRALINRHRRRFAIGMSVLLAVALATAEFAHMRRIRHGLLGEYYASPALQNLYKKRVDPVVSFRWGHGGPFLYWRTDNFSIRWTGYLRIPSGGRWRLVTYADDGVRLFLGKKLVIDDWTIHRPVAREATLDLAEGYYPITLEYFEARANANVELLWSKGRQKRAWPIGTKFLVPSAKYLDNDIPVIEDLDHPESADAVPSDDNAVSSDDGGASNDGADGRAGDGNKTPPAKRR